MKLTWFSTPVRCCTQASKRLSVLLDVALQKRPARLGDTAIRALRENVRLVIIVQIKRVAYRQFDSVWLTVTRRKVARVFAVPVSGHAGMGVMSVRSAGAACMRPVCCLSSNRRTALSSAPLPRWRYTCKGMAYADVYKPSNKAMKRHSSYIRAIGHVASNIVKHSALACRPACVRWEWQSRGWRHSRGDGCAPRRVMRT